MQQFVLNRVGWVQQPLASAAETSTDPAARGTLPLQCLWSWQRGYLISFWKHRPSLMMANLPVMEIYSGLTIDFATLPWKKKQKKKAECLSLQHCSETQIVTIVPEDTGGTGYCFLSCKGTQLLLEVLGSQHSVAPGPAGSITQWLSTGFPVPPHSHLVWAFQHKHLVCSALGLPAEPAKEVASTAGDLWGRHMPAAE